MGVPLSLFRIALGIAQGIALHLLQSVFDSVVMIIVGRLSTYSIEVFFPTFFLAFPFICEKCASICTKQCGGCWALWAINRFQCIVKVLHVISVCKRLDFFCFLAQPGVLPFPKPVLDCLTNVAVGRLLQQFRAKIGISSHQRTHN